MSRWKKGTFYRLIRNLLFFLYFINIPIHPRYYCPVKTNETITINETGKNKTILYSHETRNIRKCLVNFLSFIKAVITFSKSNKKRLHTFMQIIYFFSIPKFTFRGKKLLFFTPCKGSPFGHRKKVILFSRKTVLCS